MADPAADADALHYLETAMRDVFASKCLVIAGACIMCYDHILTFPQEVALVWKQRWSLVSTLFVLNRYITPLVVAVDVYDKGGLSSFLPQSFCIHWYYSETVWNLVSFALIHALVALRVHAIWGRPRWLSITLSVLFVIYFVATAVIAFKFQAEVAGTVAFNPQFRFCYAVVSPHLWTCWLPALVYEGILFGLTLTKAAEHSKKSINTPILSVLYRDGVMYFFVICCCSVFNMMVWLAAPPTLGALAKYFTLAFVPTMGARLVLNLKGARREDLIPTGRSIPDDAAGFEMHGKVTANKSLGDRLVFSPSTQDMYKDGPRLSVNDHAYLSRSRSEFDFDDVPTRDTKPQGTWDVV